MLTYVHVNCERHTKGLGWGSMYKYHGGASLRPYNTGKGFKAHCHWTCTQCKNPLRVKAGFILAPGSLLEAIIGEISTQ